LELETMQGLTLEKLKQDLVLPISTIKDLLEVLT
jgi:hypothetical protein